jgi:hypothetical protein
MFASLACGSVASLAPVVTAAIRDRTHTASAAAGAGYQPLEQLGPVVIGGFLVAFGALLALASLAVCASGWTQPAAARSRLRKLWRRGRRSERAPVSDHAAAARAGGDAAPDHGRAWGRVRVAAGDQDQVVWRPLAEDIEGVGRVEWDSHTIRTFAGQPEILHRLAFHRWRYQQGHLSDFAAPRRAHQPAASGAEGLQPPPRRATSGAGESRSIAQPAASSPEE